MHDKFEDKCEGFLITYKEFYLVYKFKLEKPLT